MIIQRSILSQLQPRAFSDVQRTYAPKPAPSKDAPVAQNPDGDRWESSRPETTSTLSDAEREQLTELRARDREVKNHEQAHVRAGGSLVSGPYYTFEEGPDGRAYAVDGEVIIDAAEVPNDPRETLTKMQRVQLAALAPVNPSPQDRKVAAEAARKEAVARAELRKSESNALTPDSYGLASEIAPQKFSYSSYENGLYVDSFSSPVTEKALQTVASGKMNRFERSPGPGLYLSSY